MSPGPAGPPVHRARTPGTPGAENDGPLDQNEEWSPTEALEAVVDGRLQGDVRDLDPPERRALEDALERYGDQIVPRLEQAGWVLKVIGRADIEPHRRIFAMRRHTLADLAPYAPIFLGIPLTHLGRKGARLTLEGGGLIAPFARRRTVALNEKGSQLFLYGRHLFAGSLLRVEGRPESGDEVLVFQEAEGDEPPRYLGIGIADRALRSVMRGRPPPEREVVVRNRLDLGLYLRAQQGVPE